MIRNSEDKMNGDERQLQGLYITSGLYIYIYTSHNYVIVIITENSCVSDTLLHN